jgi:hypothetical protein
MAGMADMIATQLFGDSFQTVYMINSVSLRQGVTPDRLLGRVNASMELLTAGIGPLGALVGACWPSRSHSFHPGIGGLRFVVCRRLAFGFQGAPADRSPRRGRDRSLIAGLRWFPRRAILAIMNSNGEPVGFDF